MAPGYDIGRTKRIIGEGIKVVRMMPNTPALVGEGYTVVCFEKCLSEDEKNYVLSMVNSFGKAQEIGEHYMDAYSAVTGSGPAFAFVIIEAMADAAVMLGIPRQDAYKAVEQTLLGSSRLALETGKHPGELKDMVCSPGGTSIEGVRTLEQQGLRGALIECIINTYKKNLDITNIR
jgi:pyrroline-5-carboxylate reductase